MKTNRYVPASIYICSFCSFILSPLLDKHSGCYRNGLIDAAAKFESGVCSIWIVEDVSRGSFLFPTYLGRSKETLLAGYAKSLLVPENVCVFLPKQRVADLEVVSCVLTRTVHEVRLFSMFICGGFMHSNEVKDSLSYGWVCFRHAIDQFGVRNLLYGPKIQRKCSCRSSTSLYLGKKGLN